MKIDNPTLFETAALPLIGPKGEYLLSVIVKGTFIFGSGRSVPAEEQIPLAYGDIYDEEVDGIRYESDILPFKPKTDVVFCATAFAPGARPAETVMVSVKVGPVEKQIMVFGERYWNHAGVLSRRYTITATKPFVSKPIVYAEAFGGIDALTGQYCAENLVGKGFYCAASRQNLAGKPLPCVEDPQHLIRSVNDRPQPVGLGFYNRAWQPRAAYAGTYDETWRKQRCPLPPEDFDARFYNGAHPDLQADGYLKGNESVTLINLTPDGQVDFKLPNVRTVCAVVRRNAAGKRERRTLAMNLDTLFFEPDARRYCMVWRASVALTEPSADDIEQVTINAAN